MFRGRPCWYRECFRRGEIGNGRKCRYLSVQGPVRYACYSAITVIYIPAHGLNLTMLTIMGIVFKHQLSKSSLSMSRQASMANYWRTVRIVTVVLRAFSIFFQDSTASCDIITLTQYVCTCVFVHIYAHTVSIYLFTRVCVCICVA